MVSSPVKVLLQVLSARRLEHKLDKHKGSVANAQIQPMSSGYLYLLDLQAVATVGGGACIGLRPDHGSAATCVVTIMTTRATAKNAQAASRDMVYCVRARDCEEPKATRERSLQVHKRATSI